MIIVFDAEGFLYQHTVYQSHTVTAVYYREVLQNMISHFKKKKKRLKKCFSSVTMHAHMLHTLSPNFGRNEATELLHTLHIAQTSPHMTSGYSQNLKKPCVGRVLNYFPNLTELKGVKSVAPIFVFLWIKEFSTLPVRVVPSESSKILIDNFFRKGSRNDSKNI